MSSIHHTSVPKGSREHTCLPTFCLCWNHWKGSELCEGSELGKVAAAFTSSGKVRPQSQLKAPNCEVTLEVKAPSCEVSLEVEREVSLEVKGPSCAQETAEGAIK